MLRGYKTWKLFKESMQANVTLGLRRPPTVGGPIGSQYSEEEFKKDEEDDEADEDGDDDGDEDDSEFGGDSAFGNHEGPDKVFPPDDQQDADGLATPDEAMLDKDSETPFGDDDEMGSFGDDDAAIVAAGAEDEAPVAAEPNMDFLGDIDPALMGDESGDMPPIPEDGGEMGEPCPDCNPDGSHEVGDMDCPTCHGMGFMEPEEGMPGEEGHDDMMAYMDADPMKTIAAGAPTAPKYCPCEGSDDDFLCSLTKQAKGNAKRSRTIEEDALIQALDQQGPRPGQPGFAPQGRVGGVGGGYTKDDFKDIPVLESRRPQRRTRK